MDQNSWLMLVSKVSTFVFFAFMGFFFLGQTGWILLVFVLVAAVAWWRSEKTAYQCPECHKYFYRDYVSVQTMARESWLKGGKTQFTYQCKQCGHIWKRTVLTASVLTSFLNG